MTDCFTKGTRDTTKTHTGDHKTSKTSIRPSSTESRDSGIQPDEQVDKNEIRYS